MADGQTAEWKIDDRQTETQADCGYTDGVDYNQVQTQTIAYKYISVSQTHPLVACLSLIFLYLKNAASIMTSFS